MTPGSDSRSSGGSHRKAPAGGGGHILYVDDERGLLMLAKRTLDQLGYQVTCCGDAAEAMGLFQANPAQFDLVVTDLDMPGRSGLEFAADLMAARPELPIILATGHLAPREEERVRSAGIRELFIKPYTPRELGDLVHRTLKGGR